VDFNRDGRLDVITANEFGDDVSVLAGDGHLGFAMPNSLPVGTTVWGMALADWDGDGNPDIAIDESSPHPMTAGTVHIFFGDGHGGQQAGSDVTVGVPSSSENWLLTADLNADGWLDLLSGSLDGVGLSWNESSGPGTFFPYQVDLAGSRRRLQRRPSP
jgi:hypothetical protein